MPYSEYHESIPAVRHLKGAFFYMPSSKKGRRSASGGGSIRKKTVSRNGKEYQYWEARVTVGIDPGTGKQIQKSITAQTQKEVRLKMQELIRKVDEGNYKEPCKLTVAQWLDMWTGEYLGALKPLTQDNYKTQCTRYLKPNLGAVKLTALDTHTIQQFINSLSNGEKAELSGKTIKNVYGVLHKALNQAVENEFITHNPASACKLPKVKKPPIHPLEPEEITKFITEALKDDYGNMFIVAIFAGIRQGELLGLPWENVDFERMTITIDRQLQKNKEGYFFCTPKNGTARSFAVAPVVMEALKKEKEKQENLRSLLGEEWNNEHNLVFTTDYGKNLVRRTVVKHYKKVLERAGLPDNRFHDLRHSFAVNSLAVGDNIKNVQSNLGHATSAFTMDVYCHVSQAMARESAAKTQKFYESVKPV